MKTVIPAMVVLRLCREVSRSGPLSIGNCTEECTVGEGRVIPTSLRVRRGRVRMQRYLVS